MEAYDIYKHAVGGKSWNGEKLKEYDELPANIKNAWTAVHEHYTQKNEPSYNNFTDEMQREETKLFDVQ